MAPNESTVALRPWPAPAKDETSFEHVFDQVHRLALQRGHLRSVTEKGLQEEIDAGQDIAGDIIEGVEKEDGAEDKKSAQTREERRVQVIETRMEMHKKLEFAKFAASNALDLVSLVLTKDSTKKIPENAFSPMFKQQKLPAASFGIDRVNEGAKKPQDQQREEQLAAMQSLAAKGSRMKTLDNSVDDLLRAATNLETEVRKETKYWNELLSISQKGWSLQKQQRRDQRQAPFLVRFGEPEASGQFRARGAAPLRMAKEGGIVLDPALRLNPKTMRIRIKEGNDITGSSSLPAQGDTSNIGIEKAIQFARDSLFEEELYHELAIESRQLVSYGVEVKNSVINILIPASSSTASDRTILIDCVERDGELGTSEALPQDGLARNVAEALRLLLAHDHRMRLYRRSRLPPPLSQQKRATPSPPLLRPLLSFIYHIQAVDSLRNYLDNLVNVLASAGLQVSLDFSRETSWATLTSHLQSSKSADLFAIDQLLETFIHPSDGLATLSLPSSVGSATEKLTIATKTTIGPPTYGVGFKVTLPPSLITVLDLSEDQPRDFRFSTVEAVTSYLDWVVALDITHTLLVKEYPKLASIQSNEPRVTIARWEKRKRFDKEISVELSGGTLKLEAFEAHFTKGTPGVEEFTWDGRGLGKGVSFKEKVHGFVTEA
ncbi:hypothetical protein BU24DRAFT_492405 [Aaosphaeria arxii CBS 175.79]|uniref:Mediator of RNA polymerase II transcription subunit 17 n=1 Tax=Aaosphaeria arxii CBS 175.79 TaxID=1450172 RepID=A0A6A5XUH7_9PLEO|nr:uncharacterized protein BU24DRAFT_492405 [Aaosphaeria arxii CBS 175.79]KAF2016290.1 hypothetical protein BU24DRAFT_492405 [Aaosphaeria arxii CBS 175.79]